MTSVPYQARMRPLGIRTILVMALPVMLASISTPLVGAIDMAVLGRLGEPALLGGVAAANILVNFVFYSFNFLRTSTTGMVAQALGAGDGNEVHAVALRACLLALAFGLLAIALQSPISHIGLGLLAIEGAPRAAAQAYFHIRIWSAPMLLLTYCFMGWLFGQGAMGKGLVLQVLLNLSNIGLSIAFVWGLGWGVEGAALATVAAETLTALLGAAMLLAGMAGRSAAILAAVPRLDAIRRMIAVNGDIVIRSLVLICAIAAFTRVGASFGEIVLAANAVLMTLFYLSGAVMDGLATASQQLSGRFYGARDKKGFIGALALLGKCSAVLACLYAALLLVGQEAFIAMMSSGPAVEAAMRQHYFWTVLTPLVGSLAFILDGVFIGASWSRDMRNMMLLSAAVFLAAIAALTPFFGNQGLWAALMVFMAARGLLLLWRLPKRLAASFSFATSS